MHVETYTPNISAENAPVTFTANAIRHFESKLASLPGQLLRLATKTSGCTGYAYVMDMVTEPKPGDIQLQVTDKLTFCIAADALNLVRNTEIDYVKEGLNGVLKFNNPNVVAECGCGESFNVT